MVSLKLRPIALAAVVALWSAPAMALQVVASIKPVHSLVAAVMEGAGRPTLLVEGAGSPHTFTLRPSDAKRLAQADVVVWVGPSLEGFLAKPIAALSTGATVVTLSTASGMQVLAGRDGGAWSGHDHAHGHGHRHAHGAAGAAEIDGHLWLDPANARAIVVAVADALATRDPANASRYQANAAAQAERLTALEAELATRLAPVAATPFLVFHDAYQYLERRYGLNAVGAIAISPERKPGARRIRALRQRVAQAKARCVFSEPQFDPSVVATVLEGGAARTAVLDPLGTPIADGPGLYPALMRRIADVLVGCLSPTA